MYLFWSACHSVVKSAHPLSQFIRSTLQPLYWNSWTIRAGGDMLDHSMGSHPERRQAKDILRRITDLPAVKAALAHYYPTQHMRVIAFTGIPSLRIYIYTCLFFLAILE